MTTTDCSQITDALKLVREGTNQDQRMAEALKPAYAQVDEHTPAHDMAFAQSYAALLKYFGPHNLDAGDWTPFFTKDVAARLALAAIEDIESYKSNLKSWFDYLNNLENHAPVAALKDNFGFLYNGIATLAWQLDEFKEGLPPEIPLKGTLQNLVKSQLAPAFKRLIAYYRAGVTRSLINATLPSSSIRIMRSPVASFESVLLDGLSKDWSEGQEWAGYAANVEEDTSVYGEIASPFVQINHCSTHSLFKSVFDEFLKAFSRIITEAGKTLKDTLTKWDRHEPHYALFLAFLRLFEYARARANTLTERHLDLYYREILRLKERSAEPGHVHLLVELAKQVASHEFKAGELFRAGKDDAGRDVYFANELDFVANQAKVSTLKTVYRYGGEKNDVDPSFDVHKGRIYASPAANSGDGQGAELTSTDLSWHPFYNKDYTDGTLTRIRMPKAEVGFAIASHYLLMAEGARTITVKFTLDSSLSGFAGHESDIACSVTSAKGWLPASISKFSTDKDNEKSLVLEVSLTGAAPAVAAYSSKTHGYSFATNLPVLLIELQHLDNAEYIYSILQDAIVNSIDLTVDVKELRALAVSNDFGPVDASKPFQPFGSSPESGSSLVIGSKEVFQKTLSQAWVDMIWLADPYAYGGPKTPGALPTVEIDYLSQGHWNESIAQAVSVGSTRYQFNGKQFNELVLDEADFSANELYGTQARQGFMKLKLTGNLGQGTYQADLLRYLREAKDKPEIQPVAPVASSLSISYVANSELKLEPSAKDSYEKRNGQFFHLTPFGNAEQHPYLNANGTVYLFPQFNFGAERLGSEAEFYIGISGLKPPQSLSLLFQIADGTANPLAPKTHINWSYLKNNEWIGFARNEVQDGTGELLNSGIVTFAVPREITNDNSILPAGQVWIRAAVHENSDAVCRLQMVAAQALTASFVDQGNSPNFSAIPLAAERISKLQQPDSAVKSVSQPFTSFGGRGVEQPAAFRTRVSERLRHKDRAIALWDYERMILEAFPQVYKVKCLNHTYYEPSEAYPYRELAAGHVTIVTIPNLQFQKQRDPLKPFTSIGLLQKIDAFLKKRMSCFTTLHVQNPKFEEVPVSFSLRLIDGFDETYYTNLLRLTITRFLSPWAFIDGDTPSFGGKIYKSVLIDFIEEQPYVDYVTDFVFVDVKDLPSRHDLNELEGSTAVSILVSAPADKHEINIIKPKLEDVTSETCACAT